MLSNHVRGVLNGIARLLIGPGPLEDMGGKDIAHIMRPVRQQSFNRPALGPWVIDPLALYRRPPRLIERVLAVGRVGAGHLRRLDEEGVGIGGCADQPAAVPVDPGLKQFIKAAKAWQDQAERL